MNQQEYQALLSDRLCELALSDKDEQKKITEHMRQLERNNQKSLNRRLECADRQAARIVSTDIFIEDNYTSYETINGLGRRLSKGILFNCVVAGVRRYRFDGGEEYFFQILMVEGSTKNKLASDLYSEKLLHSASKLQGTILSNYAAVSGGTYKKMAWEWMKKQIIAFYEAAPVILIPSNPGWFYDGKCYRFCSRSEQDIWFYSKNIRKFNVERYNEEDVGVIIAELLSRSIKQLGEIKTGVFLLYRWATLLNRLASDDPFPITLTLIGQEARKVAKDFLCVFESNEDEVNLDSDNISHIKGKIKKMQDTPLLLFSSNPNGKSIQNRIPQIMSWINTGIMENTRIRIPFIFCLRSLSRWYPLNETVVIDLDSIVCPEKNKTFARLQSFLISKIEESGEYWVNMLKRSYHRYAASEKSDECRFSLFYAAMEIVLSILKPELQPDIYIKFKNVLSNGLSEIIRQNTLKYGILLEVFRDAVIDIVDQGQLFVVNKNMVPEKNFQDCIFYDSKYYFFTPVILKRVGQWAKIDDKSLLFLRQKLYEQEMIETYKYLGGSSLELQKDLRIRMKNGTVKDLSGIAVLHNFWDSIGGIKLYERSYEFDA